MKEPKGKKNKDEVRTSTFEKENISHTIEYKFTEEELRLKSRELAHAIQDKDKIDSQLKEIKGEYKNKLDAKLTEIDTLSKHISNGSHMITVKCRAVFRPDDCKKDFYYEGKLYATEKMLASDYQTKLEIREHEEVEPKSKDLF